LIHFESIGVAKPVIVIVTISVKFGAGAGLHISNEISLNIGSISQKETAGAFIKVKEQITSFCITRFSVKQYIVGRYRAVHLEWCRRNIVSW